MSASTSLLALFSDPPAKRAANGLERTRVVNAGVPYVDVAHFTVLPHVLTVRCYATQYCLPVHVAREPIISSRYNDTGGKAFYIPLPGAWERLVKVIQIEDLVAFRGCVD